jgi:VanZ family protein
MTLLSTSRLMSKVAFWAALLFSFFNAIVPSNMALSLFPWDKAEHFVAFYILTLLGVVAFPRLSVIWIGVVLSASGALMEFVQAILPLGRDCDYKDWIIDCAGIAAVLVPMQAHRLRKHL